MASRSRLLAVALASLAFASAAHAMGAPDCAPEELASVDAWLGKHPWKVGATTPDALVAAACKLWPFDKSALIVAAAYAQDQEQGKNLVVALVDFARRNQADHIVMGARGNSLLRRYLGSVSSTVVAESLCTVTVVRASAPDAVPAEPVKQATASDGIS